MENILRHILELAADTEVIKVNYRWNKTPTPVGRVLLFCQEKPLKNIKCCEKGCLLSD